MPREIVAANPSPMTLDGTRTFIVGRDQPVVIDPGPDDPAHLDAILRALGGITPAAILLTHAHADHAAAAPPLAESTGAPVMMARGALHDPFDRSRVSRWLSDGDEVGTGEGVLRVVATPGHAPEHVSFFHPASGALFVGDTFMGQGDTTLVSPPEGDLSAYLRTLDRIGRLAPAVLYPAHGPAIRDVPAAVERYRKHRAERIAQVVRALRRGGPSRTAGLVDIVYGTELHPALRGAAEGSLEAILGYLAAEGQARALPDGTYTLADG